MMMVTRCDDKGLRVGSKAPPSDRTSPRPRRSSATHVKQHLAKDQHGSPHRTGHGDHDLSCCAHAASHTIADVAELDDLLVLTRHGKMGQGLNDAC